MTEKAYRRQRRTARWVAALGALFLTLLVMTWQHTGMDGVPPWYTLLAAVVVGLGLGLLLRNLLLLGLFLEPGQLRRAAAPAFALGLGAVCLLLVLEQAGAASFLGDSQLGILGCTVEKHWIFDSAATLVFPTGVVLLAQLPGRWTFWTGTAALTLAETLLFWSMSASWQVCLFALQFCAVAVVLWCGVRRPPRRHLDSAACLVVYAAALAGLFCLHGAGQPLTAFLTPDGWPEEADRVAELLRIARPLGRAPGSVSSVLLLWGSGDPLHFLLYYGGWVPALVYLALLVLFGVGLLRLAASPVCRGRADRAVTVTALCNLWLRILIGVPHSLGWLPIAVGLPFSGLVGLFMDSFSLWLVLMGTLPHTRHDEMVFWIIDEEEDLAEPEEMPPPVYSLWVRLTGRRPEDRLPRLVLLAAVTAAAVALWNWGVLALGQGMPTVEELYHQLTQWVAL